MTKAHCSDRREGSRCRFRWATTRHPRAPRTHTRCVWGEPPGVGGVWLLFWIGYSNRHARQSVLTGAMCVREVDDSLKTAIRITLSHFAALFIEVKAETSTVESRYNIVFVLRVLCVCMRVGVISACECGCGGCCTAVRAYHHTPPHKHQPQHTRAKQGNTTDTAKLQVRA